MGPQCININCPGISRLSELAISVLGIGQTGPCSPPPPLRHHHHRHPHLVRLLLYEHGTRLRWRPPAGRTWRHEGGLRIYIASACDPAHNYNMVITRSACAALLVLDRWGRPQVANLDRSSICPMQPDFYQLIGVNAWYWAPGA